MKVIFVQTTPSQLDAPFYGRLAKELRGASVVVVWNEYGLKRTTVDPELGVVPQFPDTQSYPSDWVDKRKLGLFGLRRAILVHSPSAVILQDQGWIERVVLSVVLRLSRIAVGFRSDKNALSEGARTGLARWVECFIVHRFFNFLVPVSALTVAYYSWPAARTSICLPYCSDEEKFSAPDVAALSIRDAVRRRYGIPADARVFLSVIKFAERENPRAVLESFALLNRNEPSSWLVIVGSGPLLERERAWVIQRGVSNVRFAGYVPYADLQEFFFATDVLVHLPIVGPWEISVPDALLAGRGVIASKAVGSAVLLLKGELTKYLVDSGDVTGTAELMRELCAVDDIGYLFRPAREVANECCSVSAVVGLWASWLRSSAIRLGGAWEAPEESS